MGLGSTNETTPSLNRNSTNRLQKKRRRAVVRQSRRAGLWERSLATAFTSCRKLRTAPALQQWQQPCSPKPWAHTFRSGPLDCTFLGTDYGGFYLPNRMCFLNEWDPGRPRVAYGFGIGSDVSYDLALASAYPSLVVRMFDPTPYALKHAQAVMETIERSEPSCTLISDAACNGPYFRSIADAKLRRSQLTVHPWAIGTSDGVLHFRGTDHGSLYKEDGVAPASDPVPGPSWRRLGESGPPAPGLRPPQHATPGRRLGPAEGKRVLSLPVKTLATIMRELGDAVVDILKIDIEGVEVEVVPQLLETWRGWPKSQWPKVILIDMDSLRAGHPRRNVTGARFVVQELVRAGYYLFAHPKKPDYSFVLPLTYRDLEEPY